jgi:hypothetical protein
MNLELSLPIVVRKLNFPNCIRYCLYPFSLGPIDFLNMFFTNFDILIPTEKMQKSH